MSAPRRSLTSRIQSFLGLDTKSGTASPDDWLFEAFGGLPSAAGVAVTPRTAIKCAPVRAAVAAISGPMGTLPLHVYKRTADGKERAADHPVYRLLHSQANDFQSASRFRELLTTDALLHNGGFAYIARNAEGAPVSLYRLDPAEYPVTIKNDPFEGPTYEIQQNGKTRQFPRENILHLPTPSLSRHGLVHDARDVIGLALVLERHASKLFANGARPSALLLMKDAKAGDTESSPKAVKNLRALFEAQFGRDGSGGTAALPGDLDYRQLTFSSVDAQFLELRKFQIEEIARVFGVPPHILYELGRATWSNSEQMRQDFLDFSLMRWIIAWEDEIALKLFNEDERSTYFAEFLTDNFVRADLVKRTEAYTKAVGGPWMLANEARAAENRPAVTGGDKLLPPPNASGVSAAA